MLEERDFTIFEYVVNDNMEKIDYSDRSYDGSEERLRSLTLNLLGNMLSSLQNNTLFVSMIQQKQYYINITETLLWYAENTVICPWNDCLAVKCLRLLWPISAEAELLKLYIVYIMPKVLANTHTVFSRRWLEKHLM